MAENYKERYTPTPIGVNGTARFNGSQTGGFLAVTAGNISITDDTGFAALTAFPCAAGQYVPLPMVYRAPTGGVVTLAGGASGTLLT